MAPLDPYRLPETVIPSAYRLRMEPDLNAATFAGTAEIDVDLTAATNVIVLNVVELELRAAVLHATDGTATMGAVALDEELERATLTFPAELAPGAYVLAIEFTGRLNDELRGFYRSTYTGSDGTTHTIATTQFEATDARRAFPCFDEPSFKATFTVTLIAPAGLAAYSNSRVTTETELGDGRREICFATTMKMSTYVVAFVVGEFESTAPIDVDGVPLRVVYPPGKGHLTAFALDAGSFSLRFFKEYFGVAYPGDKVDLVAIPDFAYGAMENLGCVTFREAALLADEATASQNELARNAMVVAHELAHMWFGDLVTMAWWEGLWLNEAFATYMQYVCIDAFRPDWKMWVRFSAERELGLTIDGLHSTRSIEFPVRAPAEAMEMADPITYQKGASVLKMLETYLGAETFRDGIRRYLGEHAYANTVTADLWAALEAVSGEPVSEIMDTWIYQGGHPIVSVQDGTLSQRPFQLAAPMGPSSIGGPWRVPVRSRPLSGGASVRQLLGDVPEPLAAVPPVVVNAGGTGFYRTSYGPVELASIVERLDALSEIERAVLLGDTWALARAGERSIADVLALASGLSTEVEPSTWQSVDQMLDFLDRAIPPGDEHRPLLAARTRALLGPLFATLGWEPAQGEDERAQVLRATLVRRLGTTGADPSIRAEAVARFDGGVVEGDLADAIVAVVNSMRRPGDFDELLRRFREAKDPLTEERYRMGLAGVADEALCLRLYDTCFDEFRMQDAPIVVARLVMNRVGGRAVWEAVTSQWDQYLEKVPPPMHFAFAIGLAFQVADAPFATRVVEFHRSHPLDVGQQRVDQALESIIASARLADRERPTMADTLR
ncbi:MAG TPA: M1 family metallopeptidase [Acidimicrobiales bacterium]|nr:M1 family metallopeptidase [Acidimicrobiales bacterium]